MRLIPISEAMKGKNPAISVEAKKKERIGDFKNPGKRWPPRGSCLCG